MRVAGLHRKAGLLVLAAGLASFGGACPAGMTPTTPGATGAATVVLLRVINESGVEVELTATFYAGSSPVRETRRLLAATGLGATELIVPTTTDRIRLVALETDKLQLAAKVGDVLADEEVAVTDAAPGDIITFVIHPSGFQDCNENGIDDQTDLSDGTSQDCNLNDRPDECDTVTPTTVVVGERRRITMTDSEGAAPTTLVDLTSYGLGTLRKIAVDVDGDGIFFSESVSVSDGTVERIPLAGGTPVPLISLQNEIGGVGLDVAAGKMYWSSYVSSPAGVRIASADLDGSNVTDVITGLGGAVAKPLPDPASAKLYFTYNPQAGTDDYVQQAEFDGSNIVSLVSNATDPRDVAVFAGGNLLAWAEYGSGGGVFTLDLGTLAATKIVSASSVTGVAIDRYNCRVYWSVEGTVGLYDGYVERSNFDGSDTVRVLDGLDAAQDVEVYPAAPPGV